MTVLERLKQLALSPFRRVIKFVAREFTHEAIYQLTRPETERRLQLFYAWNHQRVALLIERNRRVAAANFDFVAEHMPGVPMILDQYEVIEHHADAIVALDGAILDMGVYEGISTRKLAAIFPDRTIDGFDSFEGLPDDWFQNLRGHFGDAAGHLPDAPANVELHAGWFADTLPGWVDQQQGRPISLLRIDCDVYSSTKTVFDELEPLIVPGTWIVFDELIGYHGFEQHEYRAFQEFIERTGHEYQYVAYGLAHTVVRLGPPG